jgi:glycerol-3-phosphate dehydrogenase
MGEANVPDLLVIGGGINGVGIARDAAGRGLSVMLVEQDDLASHTSSWSSKLIHGGLRYLEHYEFRLVREALIEREVLLRAAPHIVWPLDFILPHSPEQRPAWMIRLGLLLYDHLGGRELLPRSRRVRLDGTPYGAPLKPWVRAAFSYADCAVDDSRLVVLNAIDARERGAVIRTRTACVGADRGAEGWRVRLRDVERGAVEEVLCRALVNATGPWVSQLLQNELGLDTRSRVRLVKGSHIVTRKLHDGGHAYILQHEDKRIVFVIPYRDEFSLIGTTDVPYEGDPAAVRITAEETAYLCRVVSRYFRREITPADVVWDYAGVRPLYDDASADPSAVTRDYVFDLDAGPGKAPLLSVFGGKLTTYRKLAEHALEKLQPVMGFGAGPWTAAAHLPGGDIPGADFAAFLGRFQAAHPWLPAEVARRLARNYGTRAERILEGHKSLDALGRHFGGGLYEAELDHLHREEWARRAEDVIWRRTKLGLRAGPDVAAPIAAWLAARAGAAVTEPVA